MTSTKSLMRRWLFGIGVFVLFIIITLRLENLATLLLLSFLLAYVLNPLTMRFERLRYVNRIGATVITFFCLLLCFGALIFIVFPEIISEFRQFLGRLPELLTRLKQFIVPWIEGQFNVRVPLSISGAILQFGKDISDLAPRIIGPATNVIAKLFGGTFSVLAKSIAVLMFPLFLFFLLKDYNVIVKKIDDLIPLRNKNIVHELANKIDKSLSAFLHGQFLVMLILGTLYSIGYSIVGIPVALGLGLFTGILCFIPYVGAAMGFLLALLLAMLEFRGFAPIFGTIVVFGTVQTLDAILITPKIIGGKLGVSPLWIVVALMAGGELFGFIGILLAVPTIAVLKVLIGHTIIRYKDSLIYTEPKDETSTKCECENHEPNDTKSEKNESQNKE